jgi:uracil-DNA glycosylase family 4
MNRTSRDLQEYLNALGFQPEVLEGANQVGRSSSPLQELEVRAQACRQCKLCEARGQVVFGAGASQTRLMFVGEAPGLEEDSQGQPFVGKAGELLTRMIQAMGFNRDAVYITHVVKCHPPGHRNPEPEEIASCLPYLKEQIARVKPTVIVALGTFAAQTLLQSDVSISKLRGRFHTLELAIPTLNDSKHGPLSADERMAIAIPPHDNHVTAVMPTLHPAFLLRNPDMKKTVWEDLKLVMNRLGLKAPT